MLTHIFIFKIFSFVACAEVVKETNNIIVDKKNARDKRDLGFLLMNLLNSAPPPPPPPKRQPTRKPITTPPAAPQPIYQINSYEFGPDSTIHTDENGYINFNIKDNLAVAVPVDTPAPPPAPTAPPPPQLSLKEKQHQAFIAFLSSLSGLPQSDPPTTPKPAVQQIPPTPPGFPQNIYQLPAGIGKGAVGALSPITPAKLVFYSKRLPPSQQQIRDNVIFKYAQKDGNIRNLVVNCLNRGFTRTLCRYLL